VAVYRPRAGLKGKALDIGDSLRGVLEQLRGISADDRTAIADLERRVVDHDGGRLKLEWGSLDARSGEQVDDLLWRDGGNVVGFLGLYGFGHPTLELAGMVDPAHRRQGIGSALLAAGLAAIEGRGYTRALLVVPRSTPAGEAFARAHGGELEHSEHFLALTTMPAQGPVDPALTLRPAEPDDVTEVMRILEAGFGWTPPADSVQARADRAEQSLVAERNGTIVATLRTTRTGSGAAIYGLAVDPPLQGRGIGRELLTRVCRQLRADGAEEVTLEVAVDNDRAIELYRSVGFQQRTREDYYQLPF
jgi:ribosomal protein S18 acetylase RimI-like enzyme